MGEVLRGRLEGLVLPCPAPVFPPIKYQVEESHWKYSPSAQGSSANTSVNTPSP